MAILFAALSASLCWQLPTYSGTKSYQNLLVEVYGGTEVYNFKGNFDSLAQLTPMNFARSGVYNGSAGSTSHTTSAGRYVQARVNSKGDFMTLTFFDNYMQLGFPYNKGYGFSLRCLGR